MPPENRIESFIDKVTEADLAMVLSKSIQLVLTSCKKQYTKVMDTYCHWLDKK